MLKTLFLLQFLTENLKPVYKYITMDTNLSMAMKYCFAVTHTSIFSGKKYGRSKECLHMLQRAFNLFIFYDLLQGNLCNC